MKFLMNSLRTLLLLGVLGVGLAAAAGPARAQEGGEEVLRRFEKAVADGQADRVLERAADRLDVTILGAGAIYSRSQARYVLDAFFREYPPMRFVLEEPSRREGNWFAAGHYWYGRDRDPLWVYARLRQTDRGWELREIRIDRRAGD